jgi:hypothetical protein
MQVEFSVVLRKVNRIPVRYVTAFPLLELLLRGRRR